jgi:hypothetical protein
MAMQVSQNEPRRRSSMCLGAAWGLVFLLLIRDAWFFGLQLQMQGPTTIPKPARKSNEAAVLSLTHGDVDLADGSSKDGTIISDNNNLHDDVNSSMSGSVIAQKLINSAYNDTYARLVNFCSAKDEASLKDCVTRFIQTNKHVNDVDGSNPNTSFLLANKNNETRIDHNVIHYNNPAPWWFQSMLRDSVERGRGLFGGWHHGVTTNPNVSMCLIEKDGTTQWRRVFFSLNGGSEHGPGGKFITDKVTTRPIMLPMPKDTYPSFVVLRDPLERFLSAYIDKCIRKRQEKHCEPKIIFHNNDQSNEEDIKSLLRGFDVNSNKKSAFELYVNVLPLKWNLHFFPQSLYCNGVYRFFDNYDSVVNMGVNFYNELNTLSERYGGRFSDKVNQVFNLEKQLQSNKTNTGVETASPDHVKEYYTPRSLRQVLEYVSIDYKLLGLKVPDWAHEMLEESPA